MSKNEVKLPCILLNGLPYTIDTTGTFAINTAGEAVKLIDPERGGRFR